MAAMKLPCAHMLSTQKPTKAYKVVDIYHILYKIFEIILRYGRRRECMHSFCVMHLSSFSEQLN